VRRNQALWIAGALVVGVSLGVMVMILLGRSRPAAIYITPPPTSEYLSPTDPPSTVRVYISGEVRQPDVYELPAGAIIRDVVDAAGGFTEEAGRDLVNLAQPVSDGMHIHVPAEGSVVVPAVRSATGLPTGEVAGIVNINTASLEELDGLPGVGPDTAQKIINYRLENGPFLTIEDIINVSGIGPAKFEAMKAFISVD